jgi:hypothetical protein
MLIVASLVAVMARSENDFFQYCTARAYGWPTPWKICCCECEGGRTIYPALNAIINIGMILASGFVVFVASTWLKKRGKILVFLACMLAVTAWLAHGWNMRRVARELHTKQGREIAHALIHAGYLLIDMGAGENWRPIFERLLSERYSVRFFPPDPPGCCGGSLIMSEDTRAGEDALMKVMNEEVARRFDPGVLERVAKDAEKICRAERAEQEAAPSEGGKPPN